MIVPKHLPFRGTKVDPERTKGQIVSLLKGFGITDYVWAESGGIVQLAFKVEVEYQGQPKLWTVMINPPIIIEKKNIYDEQRRSIVKKDIPNYSQSYRILLNHLKAKLTAVAIGIVKFEEEFMADIAVPTRSEERRVGKECRL